ncbi:hypothetical protein SLEP1_g32879 [Rubroshorea leprosula]|uniref:C2 NT-type domain-containing protein n=1 Tax=Rubroshorea leprosula TaxID=152421 RepID=A0AAV5KET0_9ROSI|nr:hypothetical protein SLEP1_g32879 [Rubroshorea leprosula]
MFKSARWRSEKNKIKAVFKLQFYATRVPRSNVDGLTISVVPGDVGKPTIRLEKAMVREGCCRWGNPVYETVKFVREPQSGKINQKIYHFIVSTGSAKGGLIGEISIDFADYVESFKASALSLPFKNSNSKAILHVSIQRVQENANQREAEEEEESEDASFKSQDRSLKAHLSIVDAEESITDDANEDGPYNKTSHNVECNLNRGVSCGSDITISSSDNSSGFNTPRELGVRNNNVHQDPTNHPSSLNHTPVPHIPTENALKTTFEENHRSQWEWLAVSDHGMSIDESTNSSQDTFPEERSEHASDKEIEKLKGELVALNRQVDVSELELQTLRKQIVKESKRGHDLSREVVCLKEERDAVKVECEKLKSFQKRMDDSKAKGRLQLECGDPLVILEEIRQELSYEKDLNVNLRLQLQKTQESNTELILAIQDLEEMLNEKDGKISNPPSKSGPQENAASRSDTDEDEEQKALEELVKGQRDPKETYLLEQKILDLNSEIEIYRRDKDELEMQMEQLALDYEILKQENHDMSYKLEQSQLQDQLRMQCECASSFATVNELEKQIDSLETELKKQSKEFSDSLVTIKELETHVKNLEEELEKQAQVFESDLEAVTHAKVEQEKRAIRAEEALQLSRWKNANTAERLQDELRRLSMQMASTFDANEKLAAKALTEATELRMQKNQLEELLVKAHEELQLAREDYEAKFCELSSQVNSKSDQIEQLLEDIDDKSKQLQHQRQHEEEVSGALSKEIISLKSEIEKLAAERKILHERAEQRQNISLELKRMKTSLIETEALVQRLNVERNQLVSTIALLKKEAEKSLDELQRMKHLKDQKETAVNFLESELDSLKALCNELKHSLSEDEVEKEKLTKQVCQLKDDLKKKEDAPTGMDKRLNDNSGRAKFSDAAKPTSRNNRAAAVPHGSKEVASLREKIKLLEGQIKSKEIALEASANSFLEKEYDLLKKIDELESRVEELNQQCSTFSEYQFQKESKDITEVTSDGGVSEELRGTAEYPISVRSNNGVLLEEIPKASIANNRDYIQEEVLAELALLKETNKSMEIELKEMQERYSEISLKFAEVEGERQQLVMTVRNLKNAKKS